MTPRIPPSGPGTLRESPPPCPASRSWSSDARSQPSGENVNTWVPMRLWAEAGPFGATRGPDGSLHSQTLSCACPRTRQGHGRGVPRPFLRPGEGGTQEACPGPHLAAPGVRRRARGSPSPAPRTGPNERAGKRERHLTLRWQRQATSQPPAESSPRLRESTALSPGRGRLRDTPHREAPAEGRPAAPSTRRPREAGVGSWERGLRQTLLPPGTPDGRPQKTFPKGHL